MITKLFQTVTGYNGVGRLDDNATINGQTVAPTFVYRGGDAVGPELGVEALIDGDMEAVSTSAWEGSGYSGTLTKEALGPAEGLRFLRVTYNGTSNPSGRQLALVPGATYLMTGRARGDGTAVPRISASSTVWGTGTASDEWQDINVVFTATDTYIRLYAITSIAGYCDFDRMAVREVLSEGTWPAHVGGTLLATGTGNAIQFDRPAYGNGPVDKCVDFRVGQVLAGTGGQVTTGDVLFNMVVAPRQTGTYIASTFNGSGNGWLIYHTSGGEIALFIKDATGTVECKTSVVTAGETVHITGYINRDEGSTNGAALILNSAAQTGVDFSAQAGDLTGATLTVGGRSGGGLQTDACVMYFSMYEAVDLFSAGATGRAEAVAYALDAFQYWCGVYPEIATGTAHPTTLTSDPTTIEEYDPDTGVTSTHAIAEGVAPVGQVLDSAGELFRGYRIAPDVENMLLYSRDLDTGWSKVAVSIFTGELVETPTPGVYYQGMIGTAAATGHNIYTFRTYSDALYCISGYAQKGISDLMAIYSGGSELNFTCFLNLSTVAVGSCINTYDSGITDMGGGNVLWWVVVQGIAGVKAFNIYSAEIDGNLVSTGDGVSVQTWVSDIQVELGTTPNPRVLSDGSSGLRVGDELRYDMSDGNLSQSKFYVEFGYLSVFANPPYTGGNSPLLIMGGAVYNLVIDIDSTGRAAVGTADPASDLVSTTAVSDGSAHTIGLMVDGTSLSLYIDGVLEDTASGFDTDAAYSYANFRVQTRDYLGPVQWIRDFRIYTDDLNQFIYGTGAGLQEGDVLLFQTLDEGEMNIVDGITELTPTFDTMVYLSMFGGNSDDPGGADTTKQWWGNIGETEPSRMYRSETQFVLQSLPATSSNLRRLESAMLRDLNRDFIDTKIASEISVSASIPRLNHVDLSVTITADGEQSTFAFTENWEASI